jgi:hypothetical protein
MTYQMSDRDWADLDAAFGGRRPPPEALPTQAKPVAPIPAAQAPVLTPEKKLAVGLAEPHPTISEEGGARVADAVAKLAGKDEPLKRTVRTADEIVAAQAALATAPEQPTAIQISPQEPPVSRELTEIRALRMDVKDMINAVLMLVNKKGRSK